jgi:DNA-binding beta-propeller fold protein YncE
MKLHVRALLTGSLLAILAPFASAQAAAGPPGSLTPIATPQLCFAQSPATGCTTAPGVESAQAVTVSADGHNVYVGGGTSIAVFTRDAKTGALTQLAGPLGCISSSIGGCARAVGLSGVSQIALAPGGKFAYATSSIANSVTGFARDVKTGALTQLKGAAGCVRPGGLGGCASGVGLLGASALAITPDGRSLYVAGRDADAVAAFSIDPTGGALLQLGAKQACIRGGDDSGACAAGRALAGADGLAISPDGLTLYVAAKNADAVAVLQRDATTGALSQQAGLSGCTRLAGGLGCTTGRALSAPSAIVSAANGRDVYAASSTGNAVAILQRDGTGTLVQPAGMAGCIGQGIADCTSAPLMTAPDVLALGGDQTSLTVGTAGDGTILTLARDVTTGLLTSNAPPAGCISTTAAAGCQALPQLGTTTGLAIAPSGDVLYAAANGGLVSFAREAPPTCLTSKQLRAGVGVATQILLPCTDPNGDTLTYTINSKATHGSLALINGTAVTYKPKPGFKGLDAFSVNVADGSGAVTPATITVKVTRDGTGPVVRLAAGPLKVRSGTARATLGCDARTAGGCKGLATIRLGGPRGPVIAHAVVKVAAGHSQVVKVPLKAQGRIALSGGAWRKATLIVVARDKNGNGGTLGRNIVLHAILPK